MDFWQTTHGGPVTPLFHPLHHPKIERVSGLDEKHRLRARLRQLRRDHVAALPRQTRALVFMRPPGAIASVIPEGAVVGLYHHEPTNAGAVPRYKALLNYYFFARKGAIAYEVFDSSRAGSSTH